MARKAVTEGGKRDEIIIAATKLFFQNGYEATSVRTIIDSVGGEVGMFYHYFKSKDELFQIVIERFFEDYGKRFAQMTIQCNSKEDFAVQLLRMYEEGMNNFNSISANLHWTIQNALAVKTIMAMKPAILHMIEKWNYKRNIPIDIAVGQLLFAISATLHTDSFSLLSSVEKQQVLMELITKMI